MNNTEGKTLIACVICEGNRGSEWAKLLTKRFSKIYVVAASSDCRLFFPNSKQGKSIPCNQLPSLIDVVVFHTGNENLWRKLKLKTQYTFEFNAVGSPGIRKGEEVHRIQRQTSPLDVYDDDVEELFEYVAENRSLLPKMCFPQPEVLPAIVSLCQECLTIQNQAKTDDPLYWLEALDCLQDGKPDWQQFTRLQQALIQESELIGASDMPSAAISQLLEILSRPKQLSDRSAITAASSDLAVELGVSVESASVELPPFEAKTILALKGSPASIAVATVLSSMLDVPRQIIDSVNQPIDWKPLRQTILVIAENQIVSTLANFRSKGFSGAVLVVSGKPFDQIKRNYRVLRFGQGSHDAFEAPWSISSLLMKASQLVPLEPENLRFLQNEIVAPKYLYEEKIAPCLQQLRASKYGSQSLVKVEEVVEQVRAKTPVACHAVVTIADEQKQVQQHWQSAVVMMKNPLQYSQGIQRFEKAVDAWKERVTLVTELPV